MTSSSATTTMYTGTIAASELVEIGENLPPGVRLLAEGDDPIAELPTDVELSVVVTDDLLDQVVVDMDGNSPSGEAIDATVTIGYGGYGEPQEITAPDPSQIVEPSAFPDFGEESQAELETALDVLADIEVRRPGLCEDAVALEEAQTPEGAAEMVTELEACFLAAGEPEAAEAIRFLVEPVEFDD